MATAEVKLQKPEFTNEPFVDFSKPENRAAMEAALKKVAAEFGREYPMYINGRESDDGGEDQVDESVAPVAGGWRCPERQCGTGAAGD